MKEIRRLSAALLLASASISPVQGAGGGDPFAFLLLQTDARPASLGGAYAAAVDDANAVFYNPAGLADQRRHNTVFMHNKQFEGINQETAALGLRQGWGIGINYLSVGDIPRTTVSNPGGSGLSSFESSDLALAGGYGRRVSGTVSLGSSLKYVRSEIDGVSAVGVGLDIGGKMDLEPLIKHRVSLGFGVGNVGIAQPQFNNRKETMPAFVRMGVAYRVEPIEGHALLAVFDLNRQTSDSFTFHPGVEWKIRDRISMRLGYDGRNDAGTGVTTGVGWSFKDFGLNYAFVPFGDLGDAHKISLSYRWGPDEGPTKMSRGPSATGRKEMKRSSIMPEIQELPKYREPTYKPLPEGDNRPKRPRYFDADKSIGG